MPGPAGPTNGCPSARSSEREVTTAVNVTTARQDLHKLVDRFDDDPEAVEITTRRGSAFLVPEETYRFLVETSFLLRSRTNARRMGDEAALRAPTR